MCTENYVKDRKSSDLVESYHLGVGADTPLRMLIGGCTSASAFFATLLLKHNKLMHEKYEEVASHCT